MNTCSILIFYPTGDDQDEEDPLSDGSEDHSGYYWPSGEEQGMEIKQMAPCSMALTYNVT